LELKFIADLHIHSRYSIATSKNLDFENLHIAAQLKGIQVVGTGDITHPEWFNEAKEKLIPAEEGLYRLREDISRNCDVHVPTSCLSDVRFLLTTEISNIYKKNGKTRKNHNLLFLPDLETAEKMNRRLDGIGNIKSDGRPILGLDARNLLEILLETSDLAFLVPAHIWTPWFSVLGSKSGFDSIKECFDDLSGHIFAAETGLSSDPEMNWQVSGLDGLTLISNSDAHSPLKLGREANIFDTELSYTAIKNALQQGDPNRFLGTFEFYPQEGKYHLDGHRRCRVRFEPFETAAAGGICPVCEKPLTRGVLNRVQELSDRVEGEKPDKRFPFYSIVPLTDVLSEIFDVGPGSKKVQRQYENVLSELGSEFDILHRLTAEQIDCGGIPLLSEAIDRMRRKKIEIIPGYDGEFGRIKIFSPGEKDELKGQKSLFCMPMGNDEQIPKAPEKWETYRKLKETIRSKESFIGTQQKKKVCRKRSRSDVLSKKDKESVKSRIELNQQQLAAVEHKGGPLMIVAGPGTGKTLTLTRRIAHLIQQDPKNVRFTLAVTFTNRAAVEMKKRLESILGNTSILPIVTTFHAFCFKLLREQWGEERFSVIDEPNRESVVRDAIFKVKRSGTPVSANFKKIEKWISQIKLRLLEPVLFSEGIPDLQERETFVDIYHTYCELLKIQKLLDYEDLIAEVVRKLESDAAYRKVMRDRFRFLFVDEYQDLNEGQYRIVRALAPKDRNICVIGDPDQSIYGFRGSDVTYFKRFVTDYPDAEVIQLNRNYRSTETILKASGQLMDQYSLTENGKNIYSDIHGVDKIKIVETASMKSEAVAIGKIIEKMVGGTGFHSMDFGHTDGYDEVGTRHFSEFAVLCRTRSQIKEFEACFVKAGIPHRIAARDKRFALSDIADLLSVMTLIEGGGSFMDLEKLARALTAGIEKEAHERLKMWCFAKKMGLHLALEKLIRFPVPGLTSRSQHRLVSLSEQLNDIQQKIGDLTVYEKLLHISEKTGLKEKIRIDEKTREVFNQLLVLSKNFERDAAGFMAAVTLDTEADIYESMAEKVTLITLHAAKGLEFPVVFIAGCEDGYLPYHRPGESSASYDEERRLLYVGMTRAKEELFITHALKRQLWGKLYERRISPFINDVDSDIIIKSRHEMKRRKPKQVQLTLFS